MNDILKKFNSLKIYKPHLNDVLHEFIFNFFKNEEEITILLKNDANQTIFKEFIIFLYKLKRNVLTCLINRKCRAVHLCITDKDPGALKMFPGSICT